MIAASTAANCWGGVAHQSAAAPGGEGLQPLGEEVTLLEVGHRLLAQTSGSGQQPWVLPPQGQLFHGQRLAEHVALEQLDAQGSAAVHLFQGFQTLGQHEGADPLPKPHEGFHRLLLDEAPIQARDQAAVQLEDVGPQLGDAGQVAVAGSQIIQGDQKAMAALLLHEATQGLAIAHEALIDFDHHLLGLDARAADDLQQGAGALHTGVDHRRLEVEEQQWFPCRGRGVGQTGVAGDGQLAAQAVELQQGVCSLGHGKGALHVQPIGPGKGFKTDDSALPEAVDRLKLDRHRSLDQQALQWAGFAV